VGFRRIAKRGSILVRDDTGALDVRVAQRELSRDTSRALGILTRERANDVVPKGWLRRFLHRVPIIFLGLSFKLSAARRMLSAVCLVLTLIGVQPDQASALLGSVTGLVLLLALAFLGGELNPTDDRSLVVIARAA
jgi:hypothetical protein